LRRVHGQTGDAHDAANIHAAREVKMKKIRVLIAILGLDQHEMGAIAVSAVLRDAGMEVIYAGKFHLPHMIVKTAMEEGVDAIGLSCHSWEYLYYLDELMQLMTERGLQAPVFVGGSVVTPKDEELLVEKGVARAFGPSSSNEEIVRVIEEAVGKG
jgi:methylmalonyl-CoA mutase C-terminal domain/subunit